MCQNCSVKENQRQPPQKHVSSLYEEHSWSLQISRPGVEALQVFPALPVLGGSSPLQLVFVVLQKPVSFLLPACGAPPPEVLFPQLLSWPFLLL